jgi:ribosomal protein S18 acetylase RimI-like enzyme
MTDIVQAIDPAAIPGVIEANMNAQFLSFARLPGAVLHDGPKSVWVDAGLSVAYFNSVVQADLEPNDVDAEVEAVVDHFRQRGQSFMWHVGPTTRPNELGRHLLAHGLTHVEDEPGMAIELDRVREDASAPPGLTIETVRDRQALATWVDVWMFPLPVEVRPPFIDVWYERGLGDDLPWRLYLGRLDGEPVATSMIVVAEGVAAVHYVVTVPEARRRGLGEAMTMHVLREARAMGYRVAVLTASPDGIGIYRRIGFREYCWFRRYEWEPSNVATSETA